MLFFWVFLPFFCMLILSLPVLGLGSKSTSLSPEFYACRSRQYNSMCWKLNLISRLYDFSWLIVWTDGINKCGWCLGGGRWCWLMDPKDPKCMLTISPFLLTPHLLDCLISTRNAMSIVLLIQLIGSVEGG